MQIQKGELIPLSQRKMAGVKLESIRFSFLLERKVYYFYKVIP